jgi:hypothetical protein
MAKIWIKEMPAALHAALLRHEQSVVLILLTVGNADGAVLAPAG